MTRKTKPIIGLMILTLVIAVRAPASRASTDLSPAVLSVITPDAAGSVLPELDDFATTVMGDPWDMNESTDLSFFFPSESGLTNYVFADGLYSAQMTTGDGRERIALLSAGAPVHTAMRIGKIGYNFPIDANHYRYLTFRMYSGNTTCNSGGVFWSVDDTYSAASMGSTGFLVPPLPCFGQPPGWYTYVVDLSAGGASWADTIRDLVIHPFAGSTAAGAALKFDYARLTAVDPRTARPFTIRWRDADGGQVTLYASPNAPAYDPDRTILITTTANSGSYVYYTGVLPAGNYYIGVKDNSGTIAWSSGPLVINRPPQVAIVKPSMTSGREYSADEIGNAWDMSDQTDLNYNLMPWERTCVINETFSNGLYSAVTPRCSPGPEYSESILYLGGMDRNPPGTCDPTVDTAKYRYLTYHFYESGTNFSMSRFGWWQADGWDTSVIEQPIMSRDIIIIDGWSTYKIDLWADDLVDETYPANTPTWQQSHPNRFRFDPNELLFEYLPVNIGLDYILLTAMDTVEEGNPFPILYALTGTFPMTLSFYYTTDPANTGALIGTTVKPAANARGLDASPSNQLAAASPLTLTYQVYLPGVTRNFFNCTENCFPWNTTAVNGGAYYVCIKAQDAYNATYRCSEAPVVVSEAEN